MTHSFTKLKLRLVNFLNKEIHTSEILSFLSFLTTFGLLILYILGKFRFTSKDGFI